MQGFSFVCICTSVCGIRTHNNISETEINRERERVGGWVLGMCYVAKYKSHILFMASSKDITTYSPTPTHIYAYTAHRHHRGNLNDLWSQYTLDECP